MDKLKVGILQTNVHVEKRKNLEEAKKYMELAIQEGADLVTLPEMFNCPYQTAAFPLYAEPEGGETWQACSSLAREFGVYLSAGSMPEVDEGGMIYNTAYVFDRKGDMIAKHRKVHLFDVDIKGGQRFQESDALSPGRDVTVFETEFGRMGICICFDFRFPELARLMALGGAKVFLVPGAFNMTTGPIHWELMYRSRAVDNQVYAIGTAPARDMSAQYTSWGHSILVSPWGEVLGQLGEEEGFMVQEVDLARVERIREELPLLKHRRKDLYQVSRVKENEL